MVDLPKIPRRLVTTEAASSTVSPSTIASLGASRGAALSELGSAFETASVRVAEESAQRAEVTTDANGMPKVERPFVLYGKAGEAFERIANRRALIETTNKMDSLLMQKRQEFDGRPDEFGKFAENYVEEVYQRVQDPALANEVRAMAMQKSGAILRNMQGEKLRLDKQRGIEAINQRILKLSDDIELVARQGGTQTEDYKRLSAELDSHLNELVNNPTIAFPKEKADAVRQQVQYRAYSGVVLDLGERVYRDSSVDANGNPRGGYYNAVQAVRAATKEIGATFKDSAKIEREALKWLRTENAALAGERQALRDHVAQLKRNNTYDSLPREEMTALIERAEGLGAYEIAGQLRTRVIGKEAYDLMTPAERATVARTGILPAGVVDKIIGSESSNNPNARATTSSASGLGQFIKGTWLEMVRQHRPDLAAGKSDAEILALRTPRDSSPEEYQRALAINREMTTHYAEKNAAALRAAGLPVTAGSLKIAHFLGTGGAVRLLSAPAHAPVTAVVAPDALAANQKIFDKYRTVGEFIAWADRNVASQPTSAGSGDVNLFQSRQGLAIRNAFLGEMRRDIPALLDTAATRLAKYDPPPLPEVQALVEYVGTAGTDAQKRQVAEIAAKAVAGQGFNDLTPAKQQELIGGWYEAARRSGDAADFKVAEYLKGAQTAAANDYKANPYGASVRYGDAPALRAIDFNNPASLPGMLAAKVEVQGSIRQQRDMDAFSVFQPGEAAAFRQAVTQGDPAAAGQIVGALAALPPDVLRATLADKEVKAAIDGMARSPDAARVAPAMALLNRAWRENPSTFDDTFGKDLLTRMQTWDALTSAVSPGLVAQKLAEADDLARADIKKQRRKDAAEEVGKITPADIASSMLSAKSWWQNTLVGTIGSNFKPPTDGTQADLFRAEYARIYTEFRAWGLDADNAKTEAAKRLSTVWGASETTGQIMKRPPEMYHQPIDGSHAWMRETLNRDIEATIGIPMFDDVGAQNWTARLIPDSRTEADIAAGRKPSYMVAITHASGTTELMMTDLATGMDTRAPENTFIPGNQATPLRYQFHDGRVLEEGRAERGEEATALRERAIRAQQQPFRSIMGGPTGVRY